jgi:hypothetical protein
MILDSRAIAESIYAIEHRLELEVLDWTVGDVHLWPLYRVELYHRLFRAAAGAASMTAPAHPGQLLARGVMPLPVSRPGRVWLASDGVSWQQIGDREIERFCSPVAMTCRRLGRDAMIVDRGSPSPRATDGDSAVAWWTPVVQRAKARALVASRVRPDLRHDRLVARVRQAAADLGISLPPLSARRFDAMSRAVDALARQFIPRMRHERVGAVLVVSYYDVAGFAFVLAAARLGVPSVDIQHGATGELHPGYANWRRVPRGGFRLLPSWFWAWSGEDAAVVDQWASSQQQPHRSIVGGHPFLEAWRSGAIAPDRQAKGQLEELLESSAGKVRVLVTLQAHLIFEETLGPLLSAMKARRGVAWWLRLHPAALDDRAAVEAQIRRTGAEFVEVDRSTSLPLPMLLAAAHCHATHSSSTVLEAQAMGLPSIVWSRYGAQLFSARRQSPLLRTALDGDAFVHMLGGLPPRDGVADAGDDPACHALQRILEGSL